MNNDILILEGNSNTCPAENRTANLCVRSFRWQTIWRHTS